MLLVCTHVMVMNALKDTVHLTLKLNPICHLLALLGYHHILHVSRITVNTVMSRALVGI